MAINIHGSSSDNIDNSPPAIADLEPRLATLRLSALMRKGLIDGSDLAVIVENDSIDDKVRYRAIELIAAAKSSDSSAIEAVIAVLDHWSEANVLTVEGDRNDEADVSYEPTGRRNESELFEIAAFAAGEVNHNADSLKKTAALLARLVDESDDPILRETAVASLGAIGAGLEAILRALNDVATVRRRAMLALAPFDDPRATAALEKGLEDRDWQVRDAAELLIGDNRSIE